MSGLPSSVLFACSHNAIRSPMAEALAALGPAALTLAEAEGLGAHGRSVSIRLNRR